MRILKYDISLADQIVKIPKYSKILKVGVQGVYVKMWVETYDQADSKYIDVHVVKVGTGQVRKLPLYLRYFDTVFMDDMVWHIYIDGRCL